MDMINMTFGRKKFHKAYNKQPDLISIIVPIYNSGPYLEECLESIRKQTYKNIEIIMVYTPSEDHSLQICKNIEESDKRFKLVINDSGRKGPGISRNIGLSFVKGKYIGFVDSDDIISDDMYECLYRNIIKYNTELSICKESRKIEKIYQKKKGKLKVLDRKEALKNLLEGRLFFAELWNKLYLYECVKDIKFIENVINGDDLMYVWEAISKANSVVYSNERKYFYRYNPCGVSNAYRKEAFKEIRNIYRIIEKDIVNKYVFLKRIYKNRIAIINAQNYVALKMKGESDPDTEQYLLSQRGKYYFTFGSGKFRFREMLFALIYQIKPQYIYFLYKIASQMNIRKIFRSKI